MGETNFETSKKQSVELEEIMSSRLGLSVHATLSASHVPHLDDGRRRDSSSFAIFTVPSNRRGRSGLRALRISNEGAESYLHMWRNAVDGEKKEKKAFEIIAVDGGEKGEGELEKKSDEFQKIQEVSVEESDRIQRMQVVDRAAAAISAAKAILASSNSGGGKKGLPVGSEVTEETRKNAKSGMWSRTVYVPRSETSGSETPRPGFWSSTPPHGSEMSSSANRDLKAAAEFPNLSNLVLEKEHSSETLLIPYESMLSTERLSFVFPPFESLTMTETTKPSSSKHDLDGLDESSSSSGVSQDGLKWWKRTGVEQRTMINVTGKSEKWAHKWCSLGRSTPLDVGHAHVWHERYFKTPFPSFFNTSKRARSPTKDHSGRARKSSTNRTAPTHLAWNRNGNANPTKKTPISSKVTSVVASKKLKAFQGKSSPKRPPSLPQRSSKGLLGS